MANLSEEQFVTTIIEDFETTCWGCGLRLVLPSCSSTFKCGWCGAITHENESKCDKKFFPWRQLRDRCFVSFLLIFMFFVICGGVWAVYPVVFSVSLFCGVFHSIITVLLAASTVTFFSLAAFRCAGRPPNVLWGSYPVVVKGHLENYTFCHYCSKPKSPRSHHCRSCRMCILDMDHHCPFIGNCVGAANHWHFIAFLVSAIVSTIYASIMSAYGVFHLLPPLTFRFVGRFNGYGIDLATGVVKEIILSFLRSTLLLSSRGLVLVYLFISSISVQIGLSVLLWQQLCYIYEGKTFLSHLRTQAEDEDGSKDCQNLVRFFGLPCSASRYLPIFRETRKRHKK